MKDSEVSVVRDAFGVPHLFAETEKDLLFGQGYVTAEDRLETLLKAYLKAEGRCSKQFGGTWVESDYEARLFRHFSIGKIGFSKLTKEVQSGISSYVAGVLHFMDTHPERVPDWAPLVSEAHVVALSRYASWSWTMRQVREKLQGHAFESNEGLGSNVWAVSPQRTKEGVSILCFDPHVPWVDEWLFHELHLYGEGLNLFGFAVPGLPWIAFGHNQALAWGFSTGGPDCVDVVPEEFENSTSAKYFRNGKFFSAERQTQKLM